METSNLIYGVNPLTISKINAIAGFRTGKHPYYWKLYYRKPWYKRWPQEPGMLDDWYPPVVKIYVGNSMAASITCKSNQDARELKEELQDQLNEFLDLLKRE